MKRSGVRKVISLGDLRLYECPVMWMLPEVLDLYAFIGITMETGNLIFPGSLAQQPSWFVEAINLYRSEVAKWRNDQTSK